MAKERILLKITGAALKTNTNQPVQTFIAHLARQLKELSNTYHFGIVMGGGNFFRGDEHGVSYGLTPAVGHQVGMLATVMNGLILQDLFIHAGLACTVLSAQPMTGAGITNTAHQASIDEALAQQHLIIFAGGVGAPFFTTDTTAVVRALQMGCSTIWKATDIDGIYSTDPRRDSTAQKYTTVSYAEALAKQLAIMDLAAFALAYKHQLKIRVFDIFDKDALLRAAQDTSCGTLVT